MELVIKNELVIKMLDSINNVNDIYVAENEEIIKEFSKTQSPTATLIMCCDSRAHTTSFTNNPENNFFIIRNIGNQYISNKGSIDFGIRVLKTPLLIFLGHTQCGAIKASLGDYSSLPVSTIHDIDQLSELNHKHSNCNEDQIWAQTVVDNVNQQVDIALKEFADLREKKEVVIIGMVFDLDNSMHDRHGRISVINVNGETNIEILKKNELVEKFFI